MLAHLKISVPWNKKCHYLGIKRIYIFVGIKNIFTLEQNIHIFTLEWKISLPWNKIYLYLEMENISFPWNKIYLLLGIKYIFSLEQNITLPWSKKEWKWKYPNLTSEAGSVKLSTEAEGWKNCNSWGWVLHYTWMQLYSAFLHVCRELVLESGCCIIFGCTLHGSVREWAAP